MTKDWLIRTKNNHILGPVTKDKIKQLISNGSIKGDDEVCSGNGYWIYIREQDLIARFIFGDEEQGFNPVQEIEPIVSLGRIQNDLPADHPAEELPSAEDLEYPDATDLEYPDDMPGNSQNEDEYGNIMPEGDDLEYPDMGGDDESDSQMDATLVDVNFADLKQQLAGESKNETEEESQAVDDTFFDTQIDDIDALENLDDQFIDEEDEAESDQVTKPTPQKKQARKVGVRKRSGAAPKKRVTEVKKRSTPPPKQSSLTKTILYATVVIFFVLVSLGLFFRNTLVKSFIESSMHSLIPNTYAQVSAISKKKSGYNSLNLAQSSLGLNSL